MSDTKETDKRPFDVLISGAGIAGVVLAIKLRRAGLSVCLIGVPRRFNAIEGMAERARMGLQAAGCVHALAAVGPQVLRTASWSDEPFDGNHEYLVERRVFDTGLWQDAQAAGVPVLPSRILRVEPKADGWCCEHESGQVIADYWVEARGRSAPRSTTQLRAPSTVALAGWWQSQRDAPLAGVHTLPQGWVWYARLPDGRLCAQVFLDAVNVPPRSGLREFYLRQLADSDALRPILDASTLLDNPHARGASLTLSEPLIGRNFARVGDAALALDPLAGHGQFEAVGSALALASCVCTQLQKPELTEIAQQFYRERMRADFYTMARNGRDFYALETRWADEHFWSARNQWPDAEPSHPQPRVGVGSVELRPVSVHGLIEQCHVVLCPDQPRGVWQIDGVPLLALLQELQQVGLQNPEQVADFARQCEWSDASVVRAVHWLGARGLLAVELPKSD